MAGHRKKKLRGPSYHGDNAALRYMYSSGSTSVTKKILRKGKTKNKALKELLRK